MKTVGHFVLHILVGTALFAVIAGAAFLLGRFTQFLGSDGAPYLLMGVCNVVADILLVIDVVCFLCFILAEAFKLLREIYRGLGFTQQRGFR